MLKIIALLILFLAYFTKSCRNKCNTGQRLEVKVDAILDYELGIYLNNNVETLHCNVSRCFNLYRADKGN